LLTPADDCHQNPLNYSWATGAQATAGNQQGMLDVRSHPFVPVGNYNPKQQAGGIINRGEVYTLMGDAVAEATNVTGRPMVYSICPVVGGCRRDDGSAVAEYYRVSRHDIAGIWAASFQEYQLPAITIKINVVADRSTRT